VTGLTLHLQARKLVEYACLFYVFSLLSALFYLHYWYVFPANQPSCLALQTASVLRAAGGPAELDRLDIAFTNTPMDSLVEMMGKSSTGTFPSWLQPTQVLETPQQLTRRFPWQPSRLQFAYSPSEGVLQLDEGRASRINLRTAQVSVPMLPYTPRSQALAVPISLAALWETLQTVLSSLNPNSLRMNVTLPCQPPVGLVQRSPWTASVDVVAAAKGPQSRFNAVNGTLMQSWNATFRPVGVCLPVVATCSMGTPLSALLLDILGGHDTVALVAVTHAVSLASPGGDGPPLPPPRSLVGHLRSAQTLRTYQLSHASEVKAFAVSWDRVAIFKLGALVSAVFILAATSVLVNFILSETQARMMRFTLALQSNMRTRRPLLPLIVAHSASSLVFVPIMLGVLFFLFEFFADQLLAFCVLMFIWFCEVFGVVSVRTAGSLEVFPRVVFLLLLWFHVYYLTFPFGFHYVCLHTAVAGVACAVWHLWSRHELPALLTGRINHEHPRDDVVNEAIMRVMIGQGLHLSQQSAGSVPRPPHTAQPQTAFVQPSATPRRVRYAATTVGGAGDTTHVTSTGSESGYPPRERSSSNPAADFSSSPAGTAAASGGRQTGSDQASARRRSHSDSEVGVEPDIRGAVRYDDDSEIPWGSRSSGVESERTRGLARDAASAISEAESESVATTPQFAALDDRASIPHATLPPSMVGGTGVTPQLIHEYFAPPTTVRRRTQSRQQHS
jgi:hypothetical protein